MEDCRGFEKRGTNGFSGAGLVRRGGNFWGDGRGRKGGKPLKTYGVVIKDWGTGKKTQWGGGDAERAVNERSRGKN